AMLPINGRSLPPGRDDVGFCGSRLTSLNVTPTKVGAHASLGDSDGRWDRKALHRPLKKQGRGSRRGLGKNRKRKQRRHSPLSTAGVGAPSSSEVLASRRGRRTGRRRNSGCS